MVRNVVSVSQQNKLAEVAEVLLRENISGAPVVDPSGACVGVLSASDVLSADEEAAEELQRAAQVECWRRSLSRAIGS